MVEHPQASPMAQRILEPVRSKPSLKRPYPASVCPIASWCHAARGAAAQARGGSALGDYLQFLAALADSQHAALAPLSMPMPSAAHLESSATRHAAHSCRDLARAPQWRETLEFLCAALAAQTGFPCGRQRQYCDDPPGQLRVARDSGGVDTGDAERRRRPIRCAARHGRLAVHWVALAAQFVAGGVKAPTFRRVSAMRSLPVASMVCAQPPYQGYRYLHCALCATECTWCACCVLNAAPRARISHTHSLEANAADKSSIEEGGVARACGNLRAMPRVPQDPVSEKDTGVEPRGR